MHFNHRRMKSNQKVNKSQRSPSDFSTAPHPGRVRACVRSRLVGLLFSGSGNVAVHTLISPQKKKKKNRTRPIRERRERAGGTERSEIPYRPCERRSIVSVAEVTVNFKRSRSRILESGETGDPLALHHARPTPEQGRQ